jgi:hypothetical protein
MLPSGLPVSFDTATRGYARTRDISAGEPVCAEEYSCFARGNAMITLHSASGANLSQCGLHQAVVQKLEFTNCGEIHERWLNPNDYVPGDSLKWRVSGPTWIYDSPAVGGDPFEPWCDALAEFYFAARVSVPGTSIAITWGFDAFFEYPEPAEPYGESTPTIVFH